MSVKLGRNYRLEVQDVNGNTEVIQFPLTCDFEVVRNTMAAAQTAEFTVFNLSRTTRNLLRKNTISIEDQRQVSFFAGYGADPPLVFKGQVMVCQSAREGTDWTTSISCYDPGFDLTQDVSASFTAGSSYLFNLQSVISTFMPSVSLGAVGSVFSGLPALTRGNAYSGDVSSFLREMTNGNLFFENQKYYVLLPEECLENQGLDTIDASTGLIGSPTYEETFIHANLVFEPRIRMAQLATMDSEEDWLNGAYKVVAYRHSGTISGSAAGEAVTEVTLFAPKDSKGLNVVTLNQVFS